MVIDKWKQQRDKKQKHEKKLVDPKRMSTSNKIALMTHTIPQQTYRTNNVENKKNVCGKHKDRGVEREKKAE